MIFERGEVVAWVTSGSAGFPLCVLEVLASWQEGQGWDRVQVECLCGSKTHRLLKSLLPVELDRLEARHLVRPHP